MFQFKPSEENKILDKIFEIRVKTRVDLFSMY